jgi:putative protease
MELLAPAGNFENFHAALEAGADAVYVGAPGLNARNLARDLTLDQIGSMILTAHDNGRKIYVALNSLVREKDLPQLLGTLSYLETVRPDALIIQDLGVLNLVLDHFPSLELHGSTLMTIHNRAGVKSLSTLGFSKVVIAREYTLKEIARLVRDSPIDIEVFVHGAMCFSYSGLCMFSSYLGGKSGLRGKCVQPCRRKYSVGTGGKRGGKTKSNSGYLFSMNDLNGLQMVPELLKIGVSSLKIEGRLRSATYVKNIVAAYRLMIDAGAHQGPDVLEEASSLVPEAMGRRTSSGYFLTPQPNDAIVQFHSGNIGNHLGSVSSIEKIDNDTFISLKPKNSFKVGDRLRLHFEKGDKRQSFSVVRLLDQAVLKEQAGKNRKINVLVPETIKIFGLAGKIDVYLVDVKKEIKSTATEISKRQLSISLTRSQKKGIEQKVRNLSRSVLADDTVKTTHQTGYAKQRKGSGSSSCELWLRVDSPRLILGKQLFVPDRYVINLDRKIMGSVGDIKRFLGRNMRSAIWALPAVLNDSSFEQIRKNISILIKSGFKTFQVAHLSQIELFEGERVQLFGDYSLNLMNSQALHLVSKLDFRGYQLSIEMNHEVLKALINGYRSKKSTFPKGSVQGHSAQLGLTVYGAPPLFVSRIASKELPYGKTVTSPKNEQFFVEKKDGHSLTRPKKPFSLLPFKRDLQQMGLNYLVVDLSGTHPGKKELSEIKERIDGKGKFSKLPTFNYLGTLE